MQAGIYILLSSDWPIFFTMQGEEENYFHSVEGKSKAGVLGSVSHSTGENSLALETTAWIIFLPLNLLVEILCPSPPVTSR